MNDHDDTPMDDVQEARVARFVTKRCSPEEEAEVRQWIAADPNRQAMVDSLTRVCVLGELPLGEWDTRAAWAELTARRTVQRHTRHGARQHGRPARSVKRRRGGSRRSIVAWPLGIAAAVVVAIGAALLWREMFNARARATIEMNEYATRPAQRAELRLIDGTRVLLNVDSRIRVPANFGSATRYVSLDGEAFFDVRRDPNRPFRVHTTRGAAEVLGTEFVVVAYPESRGMEVAVVSGAVALRRPVSDTGAIGSGASATTAAGTAVAADSGLAVRLARGDVAQLDSTGIPGVRRGVDLTPYTGWTDGNLVFEGMPLEEAVPRIERWYDVHIELRDEALGERRLTATFHNEPLSSVLDLLALSFNLSVEHRERIVVLTPKVETHAR